VVDDRSGRTGRSEVALDDRGRFARPREVRERYGDRCPVVAVHDGVRFVPTEDDPDARGAEFVSRAERTTRPLPCTSRAGTRRDQHTTEETGR